MLFCWRARSSVCAPKERVARNEAMAGLGSSDSGGASKAGRPFTPDDDVLFRDVSHARSVVNRLVGTAHTMSRTETEESTDSGRPPAYNPLQFGLPAPAHQTPAKKRGSRK